MKFSVPSLATWSLWFENHHPSRCPVSASSIAETVGLSDTGSAKPSPGLALIAPTTIYIGRRTLFAFKVIGNPKDGDQVRARLQFGNNSGATVDFARVTAADVLSEYELTDPVFSAWDATFTKSGNFLLEYLMSGESDYRAVAQIIVYGSNPSFFAITSGAGPDGQLFLNRQVTLTFYGANLNSKPRIGDKAKFVDQNLYACDEAAPAGGGIPVTDDLGPGDIDYNMSQTTWTSTLSVGGMYRVCYKRAGADWQEVVSQADLPDLGPATDPPAGSIPIPTDPDTGFECQLSPPRPNPPTYSTYLALKLNTNVFSARFRKAFAKTLCIEEDDVAVLDMSQYAVRGGTRIQIYIDIVCQRYGRNSRCSGTERKNQVLYLWNNQQLPLVDIGIVDVKEMNANGVFGIESTPPTSVTPANSSQTAVIVIVCLTVLGVVGMIVYAVVRYTRGHRFIQVGHATNDDGEDEHDLRGRPGSRSSDPIPPVPGKA
jgi:hypothetical protein